MGAHALLSASSAHRWLHCPQSVRATENIEDRTSTYAAEGTLAHSLAELLVQERLGRIYDLVIPQRYINHPLFYDDMLNDLRPYVDYVEEALLAMGEGAVFRLEEKVSYEKYAPGGFGTADALLMKDGKLEIVDLKFGKGIKVGAHENPQLMLYALGAIEAYTPIFDFKTVRMTIVQPRLDHISSFDMSVDNLISWGTDYVWPRAKQAYHAQGEWSAGAWCMFCKLKSVCTARAEAYMNRYKANCGKVLSPEERAELLKGLDEVITWAKEVQEGALADVLDGISIPGWKAVEGRPTRKIDDEKGLAEALLKEADEKSIYGEPKLKTITELEKFFGKKRFSELAEPFIGKKNGKPKLVTDDDSRPALGSAEADFDFE